MDPLQTLLDHMVSEIRQGKTEQGYTSLSLTLVGNMADGGRETIEFPMLVPITGQNYLGFGIMSDAARPPGEEYEERGPGPHVPMVLLYGWQAIPPDDDDVVYTITVKRVVTYKGYGGGGAGLVSVFHENGGETPLPHLVRHSPTGLGWGYAGSGPADLARSLLVHASGEEVSEAEYQAFKFEVVAKMPEEWVLPQHAVVTWHEQWKDGHG